MFGGAAGASVARAMGQTEMDAAAKHHTVLLFYPSSKQLFPASTWAFEQAQGSRASVLKRNLGALVMERDGLVRRIENIDRLGPVNRNFPRLALDIIFGLTRISVRFSDPISYSTDALRTLSLGYLGSDQSQENMELEDPAQMAATVARLRAATTNQQLFDAFTLPSPHDALDLL
jgi:ribonucleotide reductase alpha subunit